MRLSPEFIQRVQEASNLVDIISQHTVLKPAGGGLMGRCPFPDHPEKTPSFSVSEQKQVYNCFGCHKKGNIFTFLEHFNGMSFREAVEYLADRARIPIPQSNDLQAAELDKLALKKREVLKANRLAMEFFYQQLKQLPNDHSAKKYVLSRGLNPETIEQFQVGYALPDWDGLLRYLTQKGVSKEVLLEAKLIKARTTNDGHFDIFRNRIIFPIFDSKNEVVAFGGRALAEGDVKYLNSPETIVFSKSKTLYGLSETAKFIRSEDYGLVVEGYMDLISLYQEGICTGVAPMGTALTSEQARTLRKMTQNIIVLFDGDSAGQGAAERSLPILLEADLFPRGVILPDGMDPDEFVKTNGGQALVNLLNGAQDLFSLILAKWIEGLPLSQPSHKVQILDKARPVMDRISDRRLRELYTNQLAQNLSLDVKWVEKALSGGTSPTQIAATVTRPQTSSPAPAGNSASVSQVLQNSGREESPPKWKLTGASRAEVYLIRACLSHREILEKMERSNIVAQILHLDLRAMIKESFSIYRQNPSGFDRLGGLLANNFEDPEKFLGLFVPESAVRGGVLNGAEQKNSLENDGSDLETNFRLYDDAVKAVRERYLRHQAQLLKTEMSSDAAESAKSKTSESANSSVPNETLNSAKPPGASVDTLTAEKMQQFMQLHRERLSIRTGKAEQIFGNDGMIKDSEIEDTELTNELTKEDESEFK